jgi:hypothetical protein
MVPDFLSIESDASVIAYSARCRRSLSTIVAKHRPEFDFHLVDVAEFHGKVTDIGGKANDKRG